MPTLLKAATVKLLRVSPRLAEEDVCICEDSSLLVSPQTNKANHLYDNAADLVGGRCVPAAESLLTSSFRDFER